MVDGKPVLLTTQKILKLAEVTKVVTAHDKGNMPMM